MRFFIIIIIGVLAIAGTSGCAPEKAETTAVSKPEPKEQNGTSSMAERLKKIYDNIDPMSVAYFKNGQRAAFYSQESSKTQDKGEQLMNKLKEGYEWINAGNNERAVIVLTKLAEETKQFQLPPEFLYRLNRLLALSYMRLVEVKNCINRSNPDNCLFPISEEGVYNQPENVWVAISIYENMLEFFPEDYETLWMLNFAYMVAGEYPDRVPEEYLIPPSAFESDYPVERFKNIAGEVGLNTLGLSGGVCMDDFNNDGFLDIIASSWGLKDQLKFFVNKGNGTFEDHTNKSGLVGITGGLNLIHADYNNDGYLDILVLRGAWFGPAGNIPNSLLKNNGDGTFEDVTEKAGLLSFHPTQTATWTDFNLDGWIDLFIANESGPGFNNPCELYINNADGTFENLTGPSGLSFIRGLFKGVTSGDINNDGKPDLYLSNYEGPNKLLLNQGTDEEILFEDISTQAGVEKPNRSFPAWIWDFNNDGLLDIFVSAFVQADQPVGAIIAKNYLGKGAEEYSRIFRNNGDNTFTDILEDLGIRNAAYAMGSNYGDIDNDGFLDFYLATGAPSMTAVIPNKMYRNKDGKSFQDVTTSGGFGHVQKGHAVSFGDIDNDGDQDIFCVLGGAFEGDVSQDALFYNPAGNKNNWLVLELKGTKSNRSAIGARVKARLVDEGGNKRDIYRVVSTGGSFGASSLQVELGLGKATKIDFIEIQWPNREQTLSRFEDVEVNQFLRILEGKTDLEVVERKKLVL